MDDSGLQLAQLNGEKPRCEVQHGFLNAIASLRGLHISSTFDFNLPENCQVWPFEQYGPHSPHASFAKRAIQKGTRAVRRKRQCRPVSATRPIKVRKSSASSPKNKNLEQHIKQYGPVPTRDRPLHLLELPRELRDLIYDIIALRDGIQIAQLRTVFHFDGRKLLKLIRRYPLEPSLSCVNKQLRHEVLSIFYGTNRFLLRSSSEPLLDIATHSTLLGQSQFTRHLRHLEMKWDALLPQRHQGSRPFNYVLKRSFDGRCSITHDLVDKDFCHCVADRAMRLAMNESEEDANLLYLARLLRWALVKLTALVPKDEASVGTHGLPTAHCVSCGKRIYANTNSD